jgi:hypothetical protein
MNNKMHKNFSELATNQAPAAGMRGSSIIHPADAVGATSL